MHGFQIEMLIPAGYTGVPKPWQVPKINLPEEEEEWWRFASDDLVHP